MRLALLEIDALEDVRILVEARCSGVVGMLMAKQHANQLMHRAMKAYGNGKVQEALRLAQREFEFNSRIFGVRHTFTRSSKVCVTALRKRATPSQPSNVPTVSFVQYSRVSA